MIGPAGGFQLQFGLKSICRPIEADSLNASPIKAGIEENEIKRQPRCCCNRWWCIWLNCFGL